mmetsp:Transcript_47063/g.134288  ORF Transcript_47063/g.134288 Transcript_47063/m.134288 type:complete len:324 (-) Transcript_47063:130-1101(-)
MEDVQLLAVLIVLQHRRLHDLRRVGRLGDLLLARLARPHPREALAHALLVRPDLLCREECIGGRVVLHALVQPLAHTGPGAPQEPARRPVRPAGEARVRGVDRPGRRGGGRGVAPPGGRGGEGGLARPARGPLRGRPGPPRPRRDPGPSGPGGDRPRVGHLRQGPADLVVRELGPRGCGPPRAEGAEAAALRDERRAQLPAALVPLLLESRVFGGADGLLVRVRGRGLPRVLVVAGERAPRRAGRRAGLGASGLVVAALALGVLWGPRVLGRGRAWSPAEEARGDGAQSAWRLGRGRRPRVRRERCPPLWARRPWRPQARPRP